MADASATEPEGLPWTQEIVPQRGIFELPWRELWRYRDMIWLLAKRNLFINYRQTVLGPFWFVLQPLMITVVFSYLFGRMARFSTDGVPHYLFYMGGLVLWNFFAETVQKSARVFAEYEQLFAKVYFPRLAVPFALVLTNMVPLLVQFGLFLAGLVWFLFRDHPGVHPQWAMLLVPLMVLQVAMLGLGVGCSVAALTRRFRDLVVGVQIGMQLWMFGSAIVFPLSQIGSAHDRLFFFLNPMVPMIESFRYAFLGVSLIEPWHVILSSVLTLAIFVTGLLLFNRAEQTSMDTV